MAITLLKNITKYAGTAAERAAMDVSRVNTGDTYFEWDTSKLYIYSGTAWVEKNGTVQIDNITAGNTVIGKVGIDPANNLMQLSGSILAEAKVVNVTLAGTKQQLDDKPCHEVTIIAKRDNTGYIYVGKSTVSSTVYGAELGELDSITLEVSNTNEIYIDASVSGEGISYVAI